jgi:hypothetical protein
VVTGALLGASANSKRDDAFRRCPSPATPCADADQATAVLAASHSRALEANIAFGIAAAAAIGAAALWFTGAPDATSPTRIGVVPSAASGASLILEGRF